jgi:hypothetical protein
MKIMRERGDVEGRGCRVGMELERCFLLSVLFDLLLCRGNTGSLKKNIRVGKRGRKRGTQHSGL